MIFTRLVSVMLPGANDVQGLWPAVWTMGNLGRAGFGASLDGMVRLVEQSISRFPSYLTAVVYSGLIHTMSVTSVPFRIKRTPMEHLKQLPPAGMQATHFRTCLDSGSRLARAKAKFILDPLCRMEPSKVGARQKSTCSKPKSEETESGTSVRAPSSRLTTTNTNGTTRARLPSSTAPSFR